MSSCWYLQFQSRSNENIFAFPSLQCNSVPQQWDTLLYPLHICLFVETWNTQKVVKRKPTNLSSIISLQFFLHLKFTYIQMHKYKLYNLMRCNKRIHLLNHIPVKTWNISITPESSPCPFSVTRGNHFSVFFFCFFRIDLFCLHEWNHLCLSFFVWLLLLSMVSVRFIQYVLFCARLLSFNIMLLRIIHAVTSIINLFHFIAK